MCTIRRLGLPLLGAATGLLLITTTAVAGSGVGAVFNLGQVNTVDAQTTLSGNPGANPQLKLINGGTGAALRAESQTGIGVNGTSVSGTGQLGQSQSGIGLQGLHTDTTGTNPGVEGRTNSTDANGAGVVGRNTGGGPGLKAVVSAGAPPLAVNSNVKVANLNADLLDDLDSSAFQKRVTGTCPAGQAIKVVNADGTVACEPVGAAGVWGLSGNSGTTAGLNFLGTTDNQALELKVNGQRALRLEPTALGFTNVIGGLVDNSATSGVHGATIAGGGHRSDAGVTSSVSDDFGTIGGGFSNHVGDDDADLDNASFATVAGGSFNDASSANATVGGGTANFASEQGAVVAGGAANSASALFSTVAGGQLNAASGDWSFAAGRRAKANHDGAFVWADSSDADFSSTATDQFSVRAGGGVRFVLPNRGLRLEPTASEPNVIGGFAGNSVQAGATGATIGGGGALFTDPPLPNIVSDDFGTVAGGFNNTAGGDSSTVGGGKSNEASGSSATIGGGGSNTASGTASAVPGGFLNSAAGAFSFAAGHDAKANHDGAFVWADESGLTPFASTAVDQFLVRAGGGAKIVRGSSSFIGNKSPALLAQNAAGSGEAAVLFQSSSSNAFTVLTLLKQPAGTSNYLACQDVSGGGFVTKCHIDKDGTFVAGSDFAESLPAQGGKASYEPGDVLSISRAHPGHVVKSRRALDPAVIGVYSTRPAVLGADKGGITRVGKEEIPVAITGIVPVKVSAENGAIYPGDLLTSSSIPGRAMKARRSPAVGTVLGKSLGFLPRGQGTIRVLVMQR